MAGISMLEALWSMAEPRPTGTLRITGSTAMRRPNVVMILTDDQGYGDLGCTGNPWLRTPGIDALAAAGVRCTDFHVQPLCTPTRGALLSGRRPAANGAWATCWGRSILGRDQAILPELLQAAGYRTGLFGKWHLGDNHPYRPFDRGFETVVAHKGGGVGQTPDAWGNNYFDDTYFHNGAAVAHQGYCTDVWFEEARSFIEADDARPCFALIATNAPHSPYLVADRYADPYRDDPAIPEPAFFGMIANIDENVTALRSFLAERGLEQDTLLIFMTDNGSSAGCELDGRGRVTRGYNAGMRGKKGWFYDGGHRVPAFWYWPAGGVVGGRVVDELCADVDLLPTLLECCQAPPAEGPRDGRSLAALLRGEREQLAAEPLHVLHNQQGTAPPDRWHSAVLTRRWRLVGDRELYDIRADPGQERDLAATRPEVVVELRAAWDAWYATVAEAMQRYHPIHLGSPAENPTTLDAMDVQGDVAWHQSHIALAQRSTGRWAVRIVVAGRYRFALRRWPEELALPIGSGMPPEEVRALIYATPDSEAVRIAPVAARIAVGEHAARRAVDAADAAAVLELDLPEMPETTLDAWFIDADGSERGAYYVTVERIG